MASHGISRRELIKAGLAGALALEASVPGPAEGNPPDVPDDELVRVAPDHWSFETAKTHRRVIPFARTSYSRTRKTWTFSARDTAPKGTTESLRPAKSCASTC